MTDIELVKLKDCSMKTRLQSERETVIDNDNKQKIELVKIEDISSIKSSWDKKMTAQEKGFLKRLKNKRIILL